MANPIELSPEEIADFNNTVEPILAEKQLLAESHILRWFEAISVRRDAMGGTSVNIPVPGAMTPRAPGTPLPAQQDPAPVVSDIDDIANVPVYELGDYAQFNKALVRARRYDTVGDIGAQLSQQNVETINGWQGAAALSGTNELFGAGRADLASMFSGDNFAPSDFSRALAFLKGNGGQRPTRTFEDGHYRAFLHHLQILDVFDNNMNAESFTTYERYANPMARITGEIGMFMNVRVIDVGTQANYSALGAGGGTVDAITALFCGWGFLGEATRLANTGVTGPWAAGDNMGRYLNLRWNAELGWGIGKDSAGVKITTTAGHAVNA